MGHWPAATAALLAGWGLIGTPAPVGWGVRPSKTLPEDAGAGGGPMVEATQLASTAGASIGGWLFDTSGCAGTFGLSAAMLSASALLALPGWRIGTTERGRAVSVGTEGNWIGERHAKRR